MALRITLDVFSGRPNPSVVVTGLEEREIVARRGRPRGAPRRGLARAAAPLPPRLGYRGVVIEPIAEPGAPARGLARGPARGGRGGSRATAVPSLRVAGGAAYDAAGASALPDDAGLERFLVSPSGPFAAAGLDASLFADVARALERGVARAAAPARARAGVAEAAAADDRCACAPLWEPAWWNDGGPIQAGNNCYNYATNHRTDTYAQPGRANGAMFAAVTGPDLRAAALADALVDAPARNKCPAKGHLVALCVSQWDFHWYRKHRSGMWTHKPGGDVITAVDEAGQPIADPRTADRGDYTQFVGFFIVRHGHVKLS